MLAHPLTPTQLAVLRAVARGEVRRSQASRSLYDSFWARDKNVNRQVNALSKRGLIRIGERDGLWRPWHMTDAGNAVLAEYPET